MTRVQRAWRRGGLIGFIVMLVLWGAVTLTDGDDGGVGAALFAAVILGAGTGLLPGFAIDMFATRHSARRQSAPPPAPPVAVPPPDDIWQRMLEQCQQSMRTVDEAVDVAPASAAKKWLVTLQGKMTTELGNATSLVRLARAEFPDEHGSGSADAVAHPLYWQLRKAVADFTTSREGIVAIAAKLVHQPDLDQVRTDLDMLTQQLPELSEPDQT
jgi:hypothetical protein